MAVGSCAAARSDRPAKPPGAFDSLLLLLPLSLLLLPVVPMVLVLALSVLSRLSFTAAAALKPFDPASIQRCLAVPSSNVYSTPPLVAPIFLRESTKSSRLSNPTKYANDSLVVKVQGRNVYANHRIYRPSSNKIVWGDPPDHNFRKPSILPTP